VSRLHNCSGFGLFCAETATPAECERLPTVLSVGPANPIGIDQVLDFMIWAENEHIANLSYPDHEQPGRSAVSASRKAPI
jgi:hypothetical protein